MGIVEIVWLCLMAIAFAGILIVFIKEKFKDCVEEEVCKKTKTLWMENAVLRLENEKLQRKKKDLEEELHDIKYRRV